MIKKSCFIMGLPAAGKSSYLAALWYSLGAVHPTSVTLDKYDGDHSYLSAISKNWADGLPVSRTLNKESDECDITLSLKQGDSVFDLSFPDLSGETFQELYENRVIKSSLSEYIKNSDSVMLFINLAKMYEPTLILMIPKHLREDGGEVEIENKPRNLREDPTQVQLVDLMQFVAYIRDESPIKLGIIISAWDMIEKDPDLYDKSPQDLIRLKLPLLWQFVTAKRTIFSVEYFGVSAQGGDLENRDIRNNLLGKLNPCDRILVIDDQKNRYNDITLPLHKIVGESRGNQ